ncbi:MAG: tail fiber domain-containing protein [Deltaproteobacteria bacterium]|nr:tail fiber domain-containing protein [Deltaproteobacteria bacterium]
MGKFTKHIRLGFLAILSASMASTTSIAGARDLSYGGRLTDNNGSAVSGPVDLRVQFFTAASGGTALLGSPLTFDATLLDDGVFQISIPASAVSSATFMDGTSETWVEIKDATNNVTYPRQQLNAAPLALKVPVDPNALLFDASGKLTINPAFGVNKIAGNEVATELPSPGQVLTWDGVTSSWKPTHVTANISGNVTGNLIVQGNNSTANRLILNDKGSVNSVALKAPDNLSGSVTLTLPPSEGLAGQLMTTDGSGHLQWISGSSPTGVASGDLTGSYPNPVLASTGISAGTYSKFAVDTKGRATFGTTLSPSDIPMLPASIIGYGVLNVINGGTGSTNFTSNGVILGNGPGNLYSTAAGAPFQSLVVPASGGVPSFGAVNLSQSLAVTGVLPAAAGGTGVASSAVFPTSGTVATRESVETLLNKTLSSSVFSSGSIVQAEVDAQALRISNPSSTVASTLNYEGTGARKWAAGVGVSGDTSTGLANNYFIMDKDANSVRMRIDSNGNVGIGSIGTSAPTTLLNVIGSTHIDPYGTGIVSNAQGAWTRWVAGAGKGYTNFVNHRGLGLGGFRLSDTADGSTITDLLTIQGNGNTGIGTSVPSTKLEVSGSSNGQVVTSIRNFSAGSSAYSGVVIGNDTAANKLALFTNSSTRTADGGAGNSTIRTDSGDLHLSAGGGQKLTINAISGNVGIGTTSPANLLQVYNPTSASIAVTGQGGTQGLYMGAGANQPWIGSSTNSDLRLITNSTEKVRVTSAGNVGIGTTSPWGRLVVAAPDGSLASQGTASTGWSGINLYNNTGAHTGSFAYGNSSAAIWADQVAIAARNNTAPIVFSTGSSPVERMRLTQGGYLGIGTTAPGTMLDVNGTVRSRSGGFQFPDGTILTTAPGSGTVTNQTSTSNINFASDTANSGNAAYNISFSTNGTQRMVVANSGGVGIGTASPESALDVVGGVSIGGYSGVSPAPTNGLIVSGNVGIGTANPTSKLEVAGTISSTIGGFVFPDGTIQATSATSGSNNSMVSGWPDAIKCSVTNPAHGTNIFYPEFVPYVGNGLYYYRLKVPGTLPLSLVFNTNGTFNSYENISASDCNVSITNLYTSGKAFNMTKGPAAQWLQSNNAAYYNAGNVGIGTSVPAYTFHVNGSIAGVGSYNALSDIRYKKEVLSLVDSLDKILAVRGVSYKWIDESQFGGEKQIGVIAQELESVIPEVVTTGDDGVKRVKYNDLIPVLIEAFKTERSQKNAELMRLTKENNELRRETQEMRSGLCDAMPHLVFCDQ